MKREEDQSISRGEMALLYRHLRQVWAPQTAPESLVLPSFSSAPFPHLAQTKSCLIVWLFAMVH